ncbi:MAG: hypothetical protein AAFU79_24240 [Myxococcota bacterium]
MTRRDLALKLTKPCAKKWEDLVGSDEKRWCNACEKHVYNLEELEPEALVRLIEDTEGRFCGRLYRRPKELTVMTGPCPVGERAARQRVVGRAVLSVATLAGVAGGVAAASLTGEEPGATASFELRRPAPAPSAGASVRDAVELPPEEILEVGGIELHEVELMGDVEVEPEH